MVQDQKSSGQSQVKWCAEHGINLHTFRYWKRRLDSVKPTQVETSVGFVPVRVARSSGSSLRVTVGVATVEVPEGVSGSLLENVLRVLMHHA